VNQTVSGRASDLIDFNLASRICRRILDRSVPLPFDVSRRLKEEFASSTAVAYDRVAEITGLHAPEGAPRAMVLDRISWVEANITSIGELLGRVEQPIPQHRGVTNSITRSSSGAQLGLMFAWLSRRILGQYDMVTGDPSRDAIYYVGPNVYGLERRHGFAPSEFRLWIALHEVTHHLQFSGVPWMRDYFFGLVARATSLGATNAKSFTEARARVFETVRRGENPLSEGGIATLLAGSELLETMREAQALMSLLEGHAEYVMSIAAPERVPGASRFANVLQQRRTQGSPAAKFVQQALGFEAKLRQYHEGHVFIDAIAAIGGDQLIERLWERREHLPTIEEIRTPTLWVARIEGGSTKAYNRHALS
jgi:coenzyme F420 biosynthesis associated uncharacterized protein